MRVRAGLSFVAFVVMIAFALNYFTSMGVRLGKSPQRTNIAMEVADINGLVVGSSVQLRGVPIGQISNISTSVAGATVHFYVDSRYKIPVASNVRLENLSALGEAYVELVPLNEGGPVLRDGQTIAATAITNPPSISQLATAVARVLSQLDPNALQRIVNETDEALPGPTAVLPNLSRSATLLRNTAANMKGKGRDLLENFQALLRNADFVGPVLAYNAPYLVKIGSDFKPLFGCIVDGVQHGADTNAVKNLGHFIARAEHLMDHSAGDIKVLIQAMLPYINDTTGALMNIDTGQILANMLAAVPEDGAVTLHVTVPDAGAPAIPAASPPTTPVPPPTTPVPPPSNSRALADEAIADYTKPVTPPEPYVSDCTFTFPDEPAAAPAGQPGH
jgi:phospholipid/cholesterol/gamma-HCH transport system substrate-binding protein